MNKLLLLSIVVLSANCVGIKVNSVYDTSIDFETYETFSWMQGQTQYQGPKYGFSAERLETIQRTIKEELESKGFSNVESNPNLLVGFHIALEEKQTKLVNDSEMLNPYNEQIKYWDGHEDYYNQKVYNFLKGTLIIDIIDAKGGNVIWQGTAQRTRRVYLRKSRRD
ncbi:MAG: DUF4136 domain-containing protein [Cytophagales bacterium]|nr:DUF4136 domain-containing protein [Cytophagales bacterium]